MCLTVGLPETALTLSLPQRETNHVAMPPSSQSERCKFGSRLVQIPLY